jgi:hypothetical protein
MDRSLELLSRSPSAERHNGQLRACGLGIDYMNDRASAAYTRQTGTDLVHGCEFETVRLAIP